MTITTDMKKIRTLAKKKGTPLTSVEYRGKSVVFFCYGTKRKVYPNLGKAVREELKRLA